MGRLDEYHRKRDFSSTPEPKGTEAGRDGDAPLQFVVQKHDATRLHYDFRLETEDGVMASWAVPKGPSTDPADKRLAVATEDHPLDYNEFEGTIPTGYGAGTVLVWDRGTYENRRGKSLRDAIRVGRVRVFLNGEKLYGMWALTRTGQDRNWILVKMNDDDARPDVDITRIRPDSVKTGRMIEEIAAQA